MKNTKIKDVSYFRATLIRYEFSSWHEGDQVEVGTSVVFGAGQT